MASPKCRKLGFGGTRVTCQTNPTHGAVNVKFHSSPGAGTTRWFSRGPEPIPGSDSWGLVPTVTVKFLCLHGKHVDHKQSPGPDSMRWFLAPWNRRGTFKKIGSVVEKPAAMSTMMEYDGTHGM